MITLPHFINLACLLFIIGLTGAVINRRNVISFLMSIELVLLSANISFVSFAAYWNHLEGQVFSIFILTVAAAEAAVGLAIMVTYFRNKQSIQIEGMNELKG